jgi:hypothetical protein
MSDSNIEYPYDNTMPLDLNDLLPKKVPEERPVQSIGVPATAYLDRKKKYFSNPFKPYMPKGGLTRKTRKHTRKTRKHTRKTRKYVRKTRKYVRKTKKHGTGKRKQ